MISLLTKALMIGAGLYLALVVALYFGQRRMIYVPNPERVLPKAVGLTGVTEVTLQPEPGVEVLAWYTPPKSGHPVLLYFHGNGGNLAGRADRIKYFQDVGFGVFMMSYRSYSGSTGTPSEVANVSDALMAYDHLLGLGHGARDIVLFGESLGTGVASQVAASRGVAGVILDAPYSSMVDAAQNAYPYVPVGPLLSDTYKSDQFIAKINAPLLILHGARDAVVPLALGKALYAAAVQPKKMVIFPVGNHTDLFDHGAMIEVRNFVASLNR